MSQTFNAADFNEYDTTINVIGGIQNFGTVYEAIASSFRGENYYEDFVIDRNEFNLRTERSRIRVKNGVKRAFLNFKNQDHSDLIRGVFSRESHLPGKDIIAFWQFSISNRLFREISTNVYVKAYFSGRTGISKEDIFAYLKEFVNQNADLDLGWSETTIRTLSTKYLNLMTKINFLEGARNKSFRFIRPSDETLVLFLYFAKLHSPENKNIYKNEFTPLSFVTPEGLLDRLKKLSIQGYFNMTFNGVDLNIELSHSYEGICDALYNRS
jgi:hypothetical protein